MSIVSGGGSGHEPFSAGFFKNIYFISFVYLFIHFFPTFNLFTFAAVGFVGDGMLTASVSGSIFASPPSSHVFYAIQCVSKMNNNGTIQIILQKVERYKTFIITCRLLNKWDLNFYFCFVFPAGCLVITPNYTGDILNFGLAIEKAKHLGYKVNDNF